MADSNTTKLMLANALKELMQDKSFEKISIKEICEKCNMNRKSFYYHFKDKYDLVNWIFDTEFSAIAYNKNYDDAWMLIIDICEYFYAERDFYKKALCIKGQNSFSDHFRELLLAIIIKTLQNLFKVETIGTFQSNFFADAFVMAFQRWILEYSSMTASDFLEQLALCIKYASFNYEEK